MQPPRFTRFSGMALAVMFTLLVGSVRAGDRRLEGTWDVTLRFPASSCNNACSCPLGQPDIPLPTLNTFLKHGGMLWSGSALFVGPGQGEWERHRHAHGHDRFIARFKFFTFDSATLRRTGSEELTKDIRLTGPDTFEATTTYDLFDTAGSIIAQGCIINETARRFQ